MITIGMDVNVLNDNSLGCVRLEISGKANLLVAITHPPSWKSSEPSWKSSEPSLKHTRNHNNLTKIVLNFGHPERKIMDLDRRSLCIRQSVRMPNVTTICT